jgi:[ribosomal protein S18]-alanine N-acetyltransferase
MLAIVAMAPVYAEQITTWRYPPPYDCYDMTGADPADLMDPAAGYYALVDDAELVGFRSFGVDGQVPGWPYDDSALDTGGGLKPELTGRGLGRSAIATGLDFGRQRFGPAAFRMTIASFNARARAVVESLGFESIGRFDASTNGRSYDVLMRMEPAQGETRLAASNDHDTLLPP